MIWVDMVDLEVWRHHNGKRTKDHADNNQQADDVKDLFVAALLSLCHFKLSCTMQGDQALTLANDFAKRTPQKTHDARGIYRLLLKYTTQIP